MVLGFDAINIFFSDFAVDCIKPDSSKVTVLFEHPDMEAFNGMVTGGEPKMLGKYTEISDLNEQDIVTIDGTQYRVRECAKKIDDGILAEVRLGAV